MLNLGQLQQHIQRNCDISDARHAGNYTLCTFLLKMREYYRWEHDIPLSSTLPRDDIGQWLTRREQSWEALEEHDYAPLSLATGVTTDPFDDASINARLLQHGYVYSSGIGIFNKPHFFLGQLARHEQRDGIDIYISACEYARDLVAPPAMSRDKTIYVRMESLRRSIWEKIEEWYWKRDRNAPLYRAVLALGLDLLDEDIEPGRLEQLLDSMTASQADNVVQHELGEVYAGDMLGGEWKDMVLSMAGHRGELVARAIRDHLADSLTTLPGLLQDNDTARLHYYFANFVDIRRGIWPGLRKAYQQWSTTGSSAALADEIGNGKEFWKRTAEGLLDAYRQSAESAMQYLDDRFGEELNR